MIYDIKQVLQIKCRERKFSRQNNFSKNETTRPHTNSSFRWRRFFSHVNLISEKRRNLLSLANLSSLDDGPTSAYSLLLFHRMESIVFQRVKQTRRFSTESKNVVSLWMWLESMGSTTLSRERRTPPPTSSNVYYEKQRPSSTALSRVTRVLRGTRKPLP